MTINKTEKEEQAYLEKVKGWIAHTIDQIEVNVKKQARQMKDEKKFLYENKADMDHMEKFALRQAFNREATTGEAAVEKKQKLQKLIRSPWFGRVDFSEDGDDRRKPVYIGIYSFFDERKNTNLIHDWRTPIASMYYDYEPGKASYEAPSGEISGEILLKRQYRIRNGRMEFMLENSMNIHDDILQLELSKASDEKMKNIVSTIQRDQNAIIRNETSRVLIIQGVAGSGKTSIALHRIAFLLYRFKENISSREILILSPNKVFADYISNVLPELGEEMIPEMGMEELADKVLEKKYKFQTFVDQVARLLDKKDEEYGRRIRFKSTFTFLTKLDEYINHISQNYIKPRDIWVRKNFVPEWFIRERYEAYHRLPLMQRFGQITRDIEENIRMYYKYDIDAQQRAYIRKEVTHMFKTRSIRELYKDFYTWMGKPELFKTGARSTLEYADVFPLIYMKIRLEGVKVFEGVKHLLVDEMQDYTPVQYAVLSRLFNCKMTILGDAGQSVNPYSSSSAGEIMKVFPGADSVKLRRSYRSTYEITEFAQKISPDVELIAIERRGQQPVVKSFANSKDEFDFVVELIKVFEQSTYRSMGVIFKSQKRALAFYKKVQELSLPVSMISPDSAAFTRGVVVCSAHMAKGLEFDQVVVPEVGANNYKDAMDKGLLYIACTRAMHSLHVSYVKEASPFLKAAVLQV